MTVRVESVYGNQVFTHYKQRVAPALHKAQNKRHLMKYCRLSKGPKKD